MALIDPCSASDFINDLMALMPRIMSVGLSHSIMYLLMAYATLDLCEGGYGKVLDGPVRRRVVGLAVTH